MPTMWIRSAWDVALMRLGALLTAAAAALGLWLLGVAPQAHADDVCHGLQWFTNCRNPVGPPQPVLQPDQVPSPYPPGTHCIGGDSPCP